MSDATPPPDRLWRELPEAWRELLGDDVRSAAYFAPLAEFVSAERARHHEGGPAIFPPPEDVFTALRLTSPPAVKVVILGQDPYFRAGQAHGLAFSVREGVRTPPSLANVFKELGADLGLAKPKHGSLLRWAEQGVLLLNTILTVRSGEAGSHARKGWEKLTSDLVRKLSRLHAERGLVFILWGSAAQSRKPHVELTDADGNAGAHRHAIFEASHPSPRSVDVAAPVMFMGSKPFSKANAALIERGLSPIDWSLDTAG